MNACNFIFELFARIYTISRGSEVEEKLKYMVKYTRAQEGIERRISCLALLQQF